MFLWTRKNHETNLKDHDEKQSSNLIEVCSKFQELTFCETKKQPKCSWARDGSSYENAAEKI